MESKFGLSEKVFQERPITREMEYHFNYSPANGKSLQLLTNKWKITSTINQQMENHFKY